MSDTSAGGSGRKPVEPKPCVECGEVRVFGPHICDDCLGEMMMGMVRRYEAIAREHQTWAFNPNFRRLAFDTRMEMRERGVSP